MEKAKSEPGGNVGTLAETTSDVLLDLHGQPIDPIWAAEFRGFFWGEGTLQVQIQRYTNHRRSVSITASMGLRSDDEPILQAFRHRFGGTLRREPYRDGSGRTVSRWVVGTAANNLIVARALRNDSRLPFKKAQQLGLWEEAVRIKLEAGGTSGSRHAPGKYERLVEISAELQRLRKWNG